MAVNKPIKLKVMKAKTDLKTRIEKLALQNFADKFNLTVNIYHQTDKRKNNLYYVAKNGTSVSPPLDYQNMNNFLLGWNNCIKNN